MNRGRRLIREWILQDIEWFKSRTQHEAINYVSFVLRRNISLKDNGRILRISYGKR